MNGKMERGHLIRNRGRWLVTFVVLVTTTSWQGAGMAKQDRPMIAVSEAVLRSAPGFLAKAVAKLPYGTPVRIIARDNGWVNIVAEKAKGWLPKSALQDAEYVLKDIGRGEKATTDTYKNDIVTAGKGFSPEFEAMMKSKDGTLNFDAVDTMERFGFKEIVLFRFARRARISSDLLD